MSERILAVLCTLMVAALLFAAFSIVYLLVQVACTQNM